MLARSKIDYSRDEDEKIVSKPVRKRQTTKKTIKRQDIGRPKAKAKVKPKQKTKHKAKKNGNPKAVLKGISILAVMLVGLGIMTYLFGTAKITQLNNEVSSLEVYRADLEKTKTDLTVDLEGIKSSSRISEDAMYKLGMTYPQDGQVVYISVADEVTDFTEKAELSGLSKLISIVSGLF